MYKHTLLGAAMLVATTLPAQMIGDRDCFGTVFGAQAVCEATYAIPNLGADGRSPAEAAATNGAQQTDFYSANFNPLPEVFTLRWTLTGPLAPGAAINYRAYGLQASTFGAFVTRFNGVAETGFLDFADGPTSVVERTFALSASMLSRANAAGELLIEIDRNSINDAVAFDYFELTGTNVVPEPSTYALLASGLVGLAGIARRRRQQR